MKVEFSKQEFNNRLNSKKDAEELFVGIYRDTDGDVSFFTKITKVRCFLMNDSVAIKDGHYIGTVSITDADICLYRRILSINNTNDSLLELNKMLDLKLKEHEGYAC